MTLSHSSHHVLDVCHALLAVPHRLGREVGVASGSVPIWEELWLKRNGNTELFSASIEEISRDLHVITALDTSAWANLIFSLPWHNFSIGS